MSSRVGSEPGLARDHPSVGRPGRAPRLCDGEILDRALGSGLWLWLWALALF